MDPKQENVATNKLCDEIFRSKVRPKIELSFCVLPLYYRNVNRYKQPLFAGINNYQKCKLHSKSKELKENNSIRSYHDANMMRNLETQSYKLASFKTLCIILGTK